MKKIILFLFVFMALFEHEVNAQNCTTDIIITTGITSGDRDYRASNTITTDNNAVVIGGSANVSYIAGTSITLEPGFEVQYGAEFLATIQSCIPSPFTMRINVTNALNTSVTLPTFTSTGSSYTIDWGHNSNTSTQNGSGFPSYTYPSTGIYTIEISGNLERIQYFENFGNDNYRIIEIENWGDIAWQSMYGAFAGQNLLTIDQNAGNPDLSSVTTMAWMFNGCSTMNSSTLNNWTVDNVTDMSYLFSDATALNQSLSSWTVTNVTTMISMFEGAAAFDQSLGTWDVGNVTDMTDMLDDTNLGETEYDATLVGWDSLSSLQDDVSLGVNGLVYNCTGATARSNIISNYNWTITGDASGCRMTGSTPKEAVEKSDAIFVYPNPVQDFLEVKTKMGRLTSTSIRIMDLSGRIILVSNENNADVRNLRGGVYLMEVTTDSGRKIIRFIKE